MIKKYGVVCILFFTFFFLHVDGVEAINTCICNADGKNDLNLKQIILSNKDGNVSFELSSLVNVTGFDSFTGRYLASSSECVDIYLYAETDFLNKKTGNYYISAKSELVGGGIFLNRKGQKFSCSEPASEENYYRSGAEFQELYDKLSASKQAYENCLKNSCSNLSSLQQQFESDLKNLESYRHKLYSDINIYEAIYPELFQQVEQYRSEYDRWIQQGLIPDYSANCALISKDLEKKLIWILNIIKYGGVVLAIGLGMFDFLKAILSDEGDANKKAVQKFIKRLIAAVLIFLLPLIIQFVITVVNINGVDSTNPFCIELR